MLARRVAATAVLASSISATSAILAIGGVAGLYRAARADDAAPRADSTVRARAGGARPPRRFEASGFVGYGTFGDTQLGNSWAPEQAPRASAMLGARVGWLAVPELLRSGPLALSLAVEAELALAPAFTGDAGEDAGEDAGARMSYFAPVFGWRAHAQLRQPLGSRVALHAVLGAGGATIASSSPFMAKETDPLGYVGLGATATIAGHWQLRVDGRQGLMPGRTGGSTRVSEVQLGLSTTFELASGRTTGARSRPEPGARPPDPDAADEAGNPDVALADADGDGLPDRLDRCPGERETVNGVADEDGCPEPDPDADGLVGTADACPMEAEDFDHFEDTDGCPERDNDRDGVDDARDVCPGEPETRNGFADSDGCPDTVPEPVTRTLASAGAVRFERGRARVTPAGRRALAPLLATLEANADMAIAITGTPERPEDEDLAKRRAEAVKWYLVDLGIAEDRIDTVVSPIDVEGAAPIAVKLRF